MEEDTIAVISQHGYNFRKRYSVESIEWLEWLNSAVSNLMLKLFWGKFGMRDYLNQIEFVHNRKRFGDLVPSKSKNIHDIHIVNEVCVMVTFLEEDDYNEGNNSSNLANAALTTSYARLRLLKMLRQLDNRVLYFDTDSVIYTSKPGVWEPPQGNIFRRLGQPT